MSRTPNFSINYDNNPANYCVIFYIFGNLARVNFVVGCYVLSLLLEIFCMYRKIFFLTCIPILITGCIPYPHKNWVSASYYGNVVDENGKAIENALIVVQSNDESKKIYKVVATDNNGDYKVDPEKIFYIYVGGLGKMPKCTNDIYVIHSNYNVFYKKVVFERRGTKICTGLESNINFVLIGKK